MKKPNNPNQTNKQTNKMLPYLVKWSFPMQIHTYHKKYDAIALLYQVNEKRIKNKFLCSYSHCWCALTCAVEARKPPGSYKKFQGRNPYNIFVAILVKTMTPKRHFEINWPLDAYMVSCPTWSKNLGRTLVPKVRSWIGIKHCITNNISSVVEV